MTAGDAIGVKGSLYARQAAAFDGTDDYILADAHAVARVAANDTQGTYSAWIYLDQTGKNSTILGVGEDNDDSQFIVFYLYSGTLLSLKLNHSAATQFEVREITQSIQPKTWTHVACVQNGIQPALYVNGAAVSITNTTATDLTYWFDELSLSEKFAIGVLERNNTHVDDFAGMISDVKYWNKALTAAEILKDYNGEALADDGTYLQLHLLKGDNGIKDQGLGADNGTLTGHAYLTGWGSAWSRGIELNAVVADMITTAYNPVNNNAYSVITKAA